MKKDKIYELKIEEDDELSGVDQISLVDEPAIMINWLAFNKVKEQNFEMDEVYTKHLMSLGESEEDIFAEGWEIDGIDYLDGKDSFVATDPNAESRYDRKEYKVRYKYILNPKITGQPAIIETSRPFCKELIRENRVFRIEDIEAAVNDFGQSPREYRGSWNCRHIWARIRYRNDAKIINKASVNTGKVLVDGFPNDITPDPLRGQPSTITSKTAGNPQPSTVRNLGLPSTEQGFAAQDFESTNDYPESASNNACKVLKWREEHGDEVKGMTQVGWTRANQLCNKENISRDTIGRMAAFERHRQNAEVAPEFKDTPWKDAGYVAWLGWGGTTGIEWAKSKIESFGYDVSTIGGYEDPGVKKKKKEKKFQIESEDKRIIVGPAMVPDLKIPRVDANGNYYEVFFSASTIRMISEKYMRNKYLDNNDEMHNGEAVKDVYVMESWIKESEEDKSNKYGFQDTPIGTWFVMMRVKNDEVWQKIKAGDLRGFSVSGYFEEVADFCREEMFLQRLADLLKEY